ncbi:MAG: hypothetical protein H7844_13960 [Nitrospirae bacterium YQR-1]
MFNLTKLLFFKFTPYELPGYNILIRAVMFFMFASVLYYQQCQPHLNSIVIDGINVPNTHRYMRSVDKGDMYMAAVFCKVMTKLMKTPDNNVYNAFTGCLYAKKTRVMVWFLFFVFLAFLFLLPPVPFAVSVGGLGALYFTLTQFLPLSEMNIEWGRLMAVYFPIICTLFLAAVLNLKNTLTSWIYTGGMAFVISYYPFFRQEVISVSVMMFVSLVLCSYFPVVLSIFYKPANHKKTFLPLAKSITIIIVIIICMNVLIRSTIKFYNAYKSKTTFLSAEVTSHGIGHPLYVAMCFAPNPYFISYSDYTGQLRCLYQGSSAFNDNHPVYQKFIMGQWVKTVVESPDVLLKSIGAKLSLLHNIMLGNVTNFYSSYIVGATYNNKYLVWLYKASIVVLPVILFFVLFVHGSERLLLLTGGFAGITAGVLVVKILTFPQYIDTINGLLISMFFIFIPAVVVYSGGSYRSLYRSNDKEFFSKIYKTLKLLFIAVIVFSLLVVSWTVLRYRLNISNAEKLLHSNPLQDILQMQHRYSYLFNRLSTTEKLQIIGKLKAMEGNGVAGRIVSTTGDTGVFNLTAAVYSKNEIHLTGYYGKNQIITNEFQYGIIPLLSVSAKETIGRVISNYAVVEKCLTPNNMDNECTSFPIDTWFFNNEYIMVSLPVPEGFLKDNKRLYIKLLPRDTTMGYNTEETYYGEPVTTVVVDFNKEF